MIELVDRLAEQSKKKKAKEKVKAEKKSDVLICDFCDCVKPITEAINVGVKEMMTTVIETQKEAEVFCYHSFRFLAIVIGSTTLIRLICLVINYLTRSTLNSVLSSVAC